MNLKPAAQSAVLLIFPDVIYHLVAALSGFPEMKHPNQQFVSLVLTLVLRPWSSVIPITTPSFGMTVDQASSSCKRSKLPPGVLFPPCIRIFITLHQVNRDILHRLAEFKLVQPGFGNRLPAKQGSQ